jgi:tetratricopeptide (TPR) repeat protein
VHVGTTATPGAQLLNLDILSDEEARLLLRRRIGSERAEAEPEAVAELIGLCAGLPLALAIVAARACAQPGLSLASVAGELRDESGRLDALDAGDPASSIRTVISWSYQSLPKQVATRLGDTAGQATSLRLLAHACARLGDHDQSIVHYAASLALYQQIGDRIGEASVHRSLGVLAGRQGRHADLLSPTEKALRLYQATDDRATEAIVLNNVGYAHAMLGDYHQASVICRKALSLHAELGLRQGEAHAWDSLGYAEQHLGNLAEATACYQRALSIFREFGDQYSQAVVLTHLGDARHDCGDLHLAREAWQQALDILDELDHPEADKLREKLHSPL